MNKQAYAQMNCRFTQYCCPDVFVIVSLKACNIVTSGILHLICALILQVCASLASRIIYSNLIHYTPLKTENKSLFLYLNNDKADILNIQAYIPIVYLITNVALSKVVTNNYWYINHSYYQFHCGM